MEQRILSVEEQETGSLPASISATPEAAPQQALPTEAVAALPTAESAEGLGARLSRMAGQYRKRSDRVMWTIPAFYIGACALVLAGKTFLGEERWYEWLGSYFIYMPFALFWVGITLFLLRRGKPRKQLRSLAQTLAWQKDVGTLGALIDTWKAEDRKTHMIATDALIELLPRLQPHEADLLNAEQRAILCRKLSLTPRRSVEDLRTSTQQNYDREVAFRIAILKAFAQVGDSSALPIVTRLAQGKATTEAQKRIQAEARICLPLLTQRIEEQRSNQTLLRASSAATATADTLLRATLGISETLPDQLLRPHQE